MQMQRRVCSESDTYQKLTESIHCVNSSYIPASMLLLVERNFCSLQRDCIEEFWGFLIALKLDSHWINASILSLEGAATWSMPISVSAYLQLIHGQSSTCGSC